MKCPDCGARFTELRMESGDLAHRCSKCGGFFMDSWAINRLSAKQLDLWRRISIPSQWVSGGNGMCPMDGIILQRYVGEAIPQTIPGMRCIRCGKWWFPRDSLFEFKPAQEAKVSYFRLWGITADLSGMILPVIAFLVLVGGVGVGVRMVQMQQQSQISAGVGVSGFSATYLGGGEVMISFKSGEEIKIIEYRLIGDGEWMVAEIKNEEGFYNITLEELEEGGWYETRILGREYQFKAFNSRN